MIYPQYKDHNYKPVLYNQRIAQTLFSFVLAALIFLPSPETWLSRPDSHLH